MNAYCVPALFKAVHIAPILNYKDMTINGHEDTQWPCLILKKNLNYVIEIDVV